MFDDGVMESDKMALIECSECKKEISDKAESCPHCGFPISKTTSREREKQGTEDRDAGRITKTSCGKFKFFSQDKEHVVLTCTTCGCVLVFERGFFKDITDEAATPLIPLSCPKCSPDSPSQKGKEGILNSSAKNAPVAVIDNRYINGGEKGFQEVVQNVGCGALILFPILGLCGLVGAVAISSASLIPVYLMIASGVCLIVGLFLFWLGEPVKTPEEERREKQQAKERADREKYNGFKYTCPMCGSHKVKNIGTGKKLAGVATVGLASKSIGKNYQCDDCNYRW